MIESFILAIFIFGNMLFFCCHAINLDALVQLRKKNLRLFAFTEEKSGFRWTDSVEKWIVHCDWLGLQHLP